MEESLRQKKVARLLQKEIGEVFLHEGRQYITGGLVTVTMVRVSPDLSFAKIYLSLFQVKDTKLFMKKLKDDAWQIRKFLGARIKNQLRIVPEIAFFIDDSLDYAMNIETLLRGK